MEKPWEIDLTVYDDEAELLAGLRRGDRMACTCLLKRFAPRLYRLAFQLTGEADEAEDVLQESFIQACANIDTFAGRSGLGTWLHRIVLNTALMHLRRRQSRNTHLISPDRTQAQLLEIVAPAAEPSSEVMAQELRAVVDQALLALPDTLRAAFVLRDIEGMSTKAAAEALGISESALKVRLHRAHLAMRGALAPYLFAAEQAEGAAP